MKKYRLFSWLSLPIILLTLSCSSKSLNNGNEDEPQNNAEQSIRYRFTRDGISTIDLGESQSSIILFRSLNNQLNGTSITAWDYWYGQYLIGLQSYVATTFSATDQRTIRQEIDRLLKKDLELSKQNLPDIKTLYAEGKSGVAGTIEVSNEGRRLVDEQAVELGQVIQKALMGMLCLDRLNHYLTLSQSAANEAPVGGKPYTQMEHYWDIAYGYLGRNDIDKSRGSEPLFLANYIEKEAVGMKGLEQINIEIYASFVRGRKALVDKDYTGRDKEIAYIRERLKDMFYKRTIYYLEHAAGYLSRVSNSTAMPDENYFHSMGEALGFIYALPALQKENGERYLTYSQAEEWVNKLLSGTDGLWDKQKLLSGGRQEGSILWTIAQIRAIFE